VTAHVTVPRVDSSWTLFLDRDGVLNRKIENNYVLNPSMLEILPGVAEALGALARRFGRMVIVTNQRALARGLMDNNDLNRVHARMFEAINSQGGRIDAVFVCPHDLDDQCSCRKPKSGLATQARQRFSEIDFARSVVVGDADSDIEMGRALGMYTVRIGQRGTGGAADLVCSSLLDFSYYL
jgi:D-glycero-D-manno-heptose 1,7-bisphosphate phosphatase